MKNGQVYYDEDKRMTDKKSYIKLCQTFINHMDEIVLEQLDIIFNAAYADDENLEGKEQFPFCRSVILDHVKHEFMNVYNTSYRNNIYNALLEKDQKKEKDLENALFSYFEIPPKEFLARFAYDRSLKWLLKLNSDIKAKCIQVMVIEEKRYEDKDLINDYRKIAQDLASNVLFFNKNRADKILEDIEKSLEFLSRNYEAYSYLVPMCS